MAFKFAYNLYSFGLKFGEKKVEIKWIRFAQSIFEMADKRSGRKSEKKGKSPVNPNQ